ncbi:MAG TPA: sulfite exporter TauE/SafE family protein [Bryobacteraceae bacterium]|nr:sulfite exporter TauE/SafE family protein [Bryobacteraceae bacterium]
MPSLDFLHASAAFGAAFVAGVVNSVAAGGTLLTFPTLIWLGLGSVTANATNTVAIWPATLGASWGYRRELQATEPRLFLLVIPSLIGGLAGASLLRYTPPELFDRLVPFLILFATLLFMAQGPVQRRLKSAHPEAHRSAKWIAGAMLFQLMVGIYGGYFGAGIGILMLAALSILGLTEIHQMNGLKVLLGGTMNGVAIVYFVANRMVYWPYVVIMVAGALAGGYGGAGMARRLGGATVRRIVIVVGFAMALSFFIRR